MFGDSDESIFEKVEDQLLRWLGMFGPFSPLWIIRRPDSLTIIDHRPTLAMFLTTVGFLVFGSSFILYFLSVGSTDSFGFWFIGLFTVGCGLLSFRGTLREAYYFDGTNGSYVFVRRFIHRKEVIEGAISQFTGAYVRTESDDDSDSYYVVLKQEGMFLTGVSEQILRETCPIFNTHKAEPRIANNISRFLSSTPNSNKTTSNDS